MTMTTELEGARKRGYIDVSCSARSWRLAHRWWRECLRVGRVYARVSRRRTWASVVVDLLPTGRRLSEQGQARADALLLGVCLTLPRRKRVMLATGDERLYLESVRIVDAPMLIKQLLKIVEDDLQAADAWRLRIGSMVWVAAEG
jgi:hypothetical protein